MGHQMYRPHDELKTPKSHSLSPNNHQYTKSYNHTVTSLNQKFSHNYKQDTTIGSGSAHTAPHGQVSLVRAAGHLHAVLTSLRPHHTLDSKSWLGSDPLGQLRQNDVSNGLRVTWVCSSRYVIPLVVGLCFFADKTSNYGNIFFSCRILCSICFDREPPISFTITSAKLILHLMTSVYGISENRLHSLAQMGGLSFYWSQQAVAYSWHGCFSEPLSDIHFHLTSDMLCTYSF